MNGAGDASSVLTNGHVSQEDQVFLGGLGSPARVSRNGLAFVVGIDGSLTSSPSLSLETAVGRPGDAAERTSEIVLTAEQIEEKLAAAEARRESAINDLRNKCSEESNKLEKARVQRQMSVVEAKEAMKNKMEKAQENQEAQREAMLDRLKKQEIRHEEVLSRQSGGFQDLLQKLDAKYTDKDGKRNLVLTEIVDKVKEHNDKVKVIHDSIMTRKQQSAGGVDTEEEACLNQKYVDAAGQRDDYFNSAEARLHHENLKLGMEGAEFSAGEMKRE